MKLYRCTRLPGRPKIQPSYCAAMWAKPKKEQAEPCVGCMGVVALAKAEGNPVEDFDTSQCIPPSEIEDSGIKTPRRVKRNEVIGLEMAIRKGIIQEDEALLTYDPEKHIDTEEIRKLAGYSVNAKSSLRDALGRAGIKPLGQGRPPGYDVGRAPFLWPRKKVEAWIEKRKRKDGAAFALPSREAKRAPDSTSGAKKNGAADPSAYADVLASLRGMRDARCREAAEARERMEAAEAYYNERRDAWQAAQDALEAVEKAAGVR